MVVFGALLALGQRSSSPQPPAVIDNLRIPLLFEANQGQAPSAVDYFARARGYNLLLKKAHAEIELGGGQRLSVQFVGASGSHLRAEQPTNVRINDYHGTRNWQTNIATYQRAGYAQLYPGIDLDFYGSERQLEHDFIVAPQANPERIAFRVKGAVSQRIDRNGDLLLKLRDGELRLKAPVAYQTTNSKRHAITSRFQLAKDGTVHFALGKYDRKRQLVIDPILSFSSYLGGSGGDSLRGLAVVPSAFAPGSVYVAGVTNSANLSATVGQTSLKGAVNGFIAKFNLSGTTLQWLTYFGGSQQDYINALAADANGNVYIGGDTTSADLPLAGTSVSGTLAGPQDGFAAVLNSSGTLVYSTYLGGQAGDRVLGVAVDPAGFIDVTGSTFSSDFPVTNPVQPFQGDGSTSNIFVSQINIADGTLPFSTTYGGTNSDIARAIAAHSTGIYVGGETLSGDFPAVNGMTPAFGTVSAFVAKFDPSTASVVYTDVFGGSNESHVTGLAVDASGLYITGNTDSAEFPLVPGAYFQGNKSGGFDAFVSKLNPAGNAFVYSSFLGGSGNENNDSSLFLGSIAVANGVAYVTGFTESPDFPVANPTQGFLAGQRNAFVSEVNAQGTGLSFSTFLGGSAQSEGWAVAVDPSSSNIYVAGDTTDTDFPLKNPPQRINGGGSDGFLSIIQQPSTSSDISVSTSTSPASPTTGSAFTYTITVHNAGPNSAGANAVNVYDTLDSMVTVNSPPAPSQGSCNQNGLQVTCTLGPLASGASATITIATTPTSATGIINTAVVRSDDSDPDLSNNTYTSNVVVNYGNCYDPSLSGSAWMGGASGDEANFNNPNNWYPTGVPGPSANAVICADAPTQPVLTADLAVNNLVVKSGASLELNAHTITTYGSLKSAGMIADGTVLAAGSPTTIEGNVPNLTVSGIVSLSNAMTATGAVSVTGSLNLNGKTASLASFQNSGTGVLVMQTAGDTLMVAGDATFNGGDETMLTQGTIMLGGNLNVTGGQFAFDAQAPHTVLFNGSADQMVTFSSPGNLQFIGNFAVNKPAGKVILNSGAYITGDIAITQGIVTGPYTVQFNGNLIDAGSYDWQVQASIAASAAPMLSNLQTQLVFFNSSTTLVNSFNVIGGIVAAGRLDIGSNVISVTGTFSTTNAAGALVMQSPACQLTATAGVVFDGGSESGLLTAGALDVGGAFAVETDNAQDSFHAVSPHLVRFNGPSVVVSVMGSNQQFGDLVVGTNVSLLNPLTVQGTLYTNAGVPGSVNGPYPLTVGGVSINGIAFNGTPLVIGNGPIATFDNVTFSSMDPSVTQLMLLHDGSSTPFTFNSTVFETTPTTGKYITATNSNPGAGPLTINLAGSTPADGTAFTTSDANSTVNWPASQTADVGVAASSDAMSVPVGTYVNFTVTVTDNGPLPATNVSMSIAYTGYNGNLNLPAGCTSGNPIVCTLGNMSSGQSLPLVFNAQSVDVGTVTFTATVTHDDTDLNSANNMASASTMFGSIGNPPVGSVNGNILYSRSDASNGTIWQAAGDGSGDAQLTVGQWPFLSPDQSLMAFHRDNAEYDRANLYVRNMISGAETEVFANGDFLNAYSFTPDSSQIYFDYVCSIERVNNDGSNVATIMSADCYDDYPRLNAAGTQFAFHNAHVGIGLANADGTGRTFIPNTAPDDYMPTWSPDNTKLAFLRYSASGPNNIFVINPDGTNITRLSYFTMAGDGPLYGGFAWTPDGSAIVFAGAVNGAPGIYAVSTDGQGTLVQIPVSVGNPPNWVGDVTGTGADISLTASAPETATTGNPLPLKLTVANSGPGLAANVTVTTTLPAGVYFISGNSDQSKANIAQCSAEGQTVTCTLPAPIAVGQSVDILLDLDAETTGEVPIVSQATTSAADPDSDNNNYNTSTSLRAPACVDPPSGMVSWYRGEFNASDYTGAHDGAPIGSPQYTQGKVGQSFSLDGSSSYIDLTTASGLWTIGSQWTVEAWVNPNTLDLMRHEVVGAIDNNVDWGIVYQNGQFGAVISPPSGITATVFANYPADLNQYSHVVATNDGTTAKLYVNGQYLNSLPVNPNYVGDNEPRIGNRAGCCNEFFSGAVDEATIYNRALDAGEVAALFNAGSAGKCAAPAGSSADISLSAASAPTVVNGHPAYSVTVTNNGPSTATDVVLTDTLNGFDFVSANTSSGGCSFDGSVVHCGLGTLAVGAGATVTIAVVPPGQGWASHDFAAGADEPDAVPTNNVAHLGPSDSSFNTAVGSNVSVQAGDSTGDAAQVTFDNVSRKGTTSIQPLSAMAPPAGYRYGAPPAVFDVATTATVTGAVHLAFAFNPASFHHPAKVRLFHMENGAWVDRTVALDMASRRVMGATVSLSPFALFEPMDAAPVASSGGNQTFPGNAAAGSVITLNGSSSSDADGDTLTYRWTGPFPEGNGTVIGATPSVTLPFGASQVTLVVNDGETDSTAVASTITVTDFTLSSSAVNDTAKSGSPATFSISVAPKGGSFSAAVNLGCSGLPNGYTCSFSPSSVTPGANASAVTMTISRTTTGSLRPGNPMLAFWFGLPFGFVLIKGKRRRFALLLLGLALVVGLFACGGGGGGHQFTQQPPTSTNGAAVTVTGTSGGLSHSTTALVNIAQ